MNMDEDEQTIIIGASTERTVSGDAQHSGCTTWPPPFCVQHMASLPCNVQNMDPLQCSLQNLAPLPCSLQNMAPLPCSLQNIPCTNIEFTQFGYELFNYFTNLLVHDSQNRSPSSSSGTVGASLPPAAFERPHNEDSTNCNQGFSNQRANSKFICEESCDDGRQFIIFSK